MVTACKKRNEKTPNKSVNQDTRFLMQGGGLHGVCVALGTRERMGKISKVGQMSKMSKMSDSVWCVRG